MVKHAYVISCVLGVALLVGPSPTQAQGRAQDGGQRGTLLQMFQEQRARRRQALVEHLATHPKDPKAHFELGQLYALDGETTAAIRAYRTVIEIAPDHATAHFNLGLLYHRSGQFEQAAQAFREVLRLDPADLPTHINLGMVYRDWRGALLRKEVEVLEAAVTQRPDYPEGRYHLGIAYRAMGERNPDCRPWYEKARAAFTAYLTAKPMGQAQETVARWLERLGKRLPECDETR